MPLKRKIVRKKRKYSQIFSDNKIIFFLSILLIIFVIRLYIPIISKKNELTIRNQQLDGQIKQLRLDNQKFSNEAGRLEKDKVYIEKIAREQLGLAKKNEVVYNIKQSRLTTKKKEIK